MTGLAARLDRPVAPSAAPGARRPVLTKAQTELLLRLATFLALAAFALGHWVSVVKHPPAGRTVALLAVCAVSGFVLWLLGTLELRTAFTRLAAALVVVAMALLALLVTGLHARYLRPHGWGALERGLRHGLLDAQSAVYPYQGSDRWVRLTLLLNGPAFLVPATALAFWPARRHANLLRGLSLVVLIVLYGMALAERSPHGQIGRGVALLLLIAAWLWLPRLAARDAGAASALVLAAAVLALPIAITLDAHKSWVDYRNWRVLGNTAGVDYQWNHSYGPIDWPRRGTTLLYVRADRPYYWKAETLNDFDGRRWLRTSDISSVSTSSEIPQNHDPRWIKQISFTVAGLRGNQVIGAGTPQSVSGGAGDAELDGDGTVTALDHSLHDGENYTVNTYIPQPSVQQMRNSSQEYDNYFGIYTKFVAPVKLSGPNRVTVPVRVDPGLWHTFGTGDPAAGGLLDRSPYAGMYRIARRLSVGAATSYDVVRKIEGYLNTTRFSYDERPAPRKYPLESFLIKDRVGYCQQFSGTMALMLRMLGIPARVATGFAPGTPQPDAPGVYRVRDLDAHSWVEVYFPDFGWVTFDPTPALSPAASQADDSGSRVAAGAPAARGLGQTEAPDVKGARGSVNLAGGHGSSFSWWMVPAGVAVLLVLGLAGQRVRRAAAARAAMRPDDRAVQDLCTALGRLGNPVPEGSTLMAVERTLERRAGPDAGRYPRLIREYRYGANGAMLPGARDRRALRRALAPTARPFGRLRMLRALPPLHF